MVTTGDRALQLSASHSQSFALLWLGFWSLSCGGNLGWLFSCQLCSLYQHQYPINYNLKNSIFVPFTQTFSHSKGQPISYSGKIAFHNSFQLLNISSVLGTAVSTVTSAITPWNWYYFSVPSLGWETLFREYINWRWKSCPCWEVAFLIYLIHLLGT